jgi:RNA polymerase sigma-70 factor (ECF subfamily)
MSKDEDDIIRHAQQGDEQAWSSLVSRYSKLVWSATSRYFFSQEDREDIVQEVFLRLVKGIDRYDPDKSSFSTFLTTITNRVCIDKLRQIKGRPEVLLTPEELALFSSSEKKEQSDDKQDMIDSLLKELPIEKKLVIYLFYLKECSYKQIAEIMNINIDQVKNILHRTRIILRQKLDCMDCEIKVL